MNDRALMLTTKCLLVLGLTIGVGTAFAESSTNEGDGDLAPCTVRGYVTWNGNAVGAGEAVECAGNDGAGTWASDPDGTDANGYYVCPAQDDGYMRVKARGQDLGQCPGGPCTSPGPKNCNVEGGGTCQNPSATLTMMLPPAIFGPAALRRRRRARTQQG